MILNRTVAPTTHIVSFDDAREHLRVTDTSESYYIETLLSAADATVEEMTGRAILPQTWTLAVGSVSGKLYLPKAPVVAVSSIAYYDADNASQTATVGDFYLFKDDTTAWLEPKPNVVWPDLYDRSDALTVTFTAGYSSIPTPLVHAAKLLIAHWFENRAATQGDKAEIPYAVDHLTSLYRIGWIGG